MDDSDKQATLLGFAIPAFQSYILVLLLSTILATSFIVSSNAQAAIADLTASTTTTTTIPEESGLDFDHFATGYPLTGQHEFIECGVCHVNGVFKGTPPLTNLKVPNYEFISEETVRIYYLSLPDVWINY